MPLLASTSLSEPTHPRPKEPLSLGLVIDIEATDTSHQAEIVEIAILQFSFDPSSGLIKEVVREYQALNEPRRAITHGARRIHNISLPEVKGKRIDDEKVKELLSGSKAAFAHKAAFDKRLLSTHLKEDIPIPWFCTLRGIPWRQLGYSSGHLRTLLKHHDIPHNRLHRARDDARALLALLQKPHQMTGKPYLLHLIEDRLSPPPR